MTYRKNILSLWVIRSKLDDLNDSILEDEFGIDDFNEDLLELGGIDDWKEMPIRDIFSGMSVSASWAEKAAERAEALGITKCRRAFIILNFEYNPKIASKLPVDPVFIGTFEFNY